MRHRPPRLTLFHPLHPFQLLHSLHPLSVCLLLVLSGCGGARPDLAPLSQEFEYLRRDTRALDPRPPASQVLAAAEGKYQRAETLMASRKDKDAHPVLLRAVADARLALAAARAGRAESRAEACVRQVDEARQKWEEAIRSLEQTERISGREASLASRDDPAGDSSAGTELVPFGLDGPEPVLLPAADLRRVWDVALASAKRAELPTADLESRFDVAVRTAESTKTEEPARQDQLYVAARTSEELQARTAEAWAEALCDAAPELVARYGARRDEALRATLELERGLKEDLRAELERARQEAMKQQNQLYDALATLEGRFASIRRDARGTIVSLADILFDFDKATLKRDVEFSLVKVATILGQFPEMKIQVEGHTDNVGKPEYNLDLSERRAKAVYEFLSSQGVDAARMTYAGFGMTQPVEDNSTDAGRAKNRRVDLVIPDAQ